jgi:hypothetical protein
MDYSKVLRLAQYSVAGAVLLIATTRCADQSPPPTASSAPSPHMAAGTAPRDTAEARERAGLAMRRGAWAGELHRQAMAVLIADPEVWQGARRRTPAQNCAIAWGLAERFRQSIDAHVGSGAKAQRRRMPANLEEQIGCPRGSGASAVNPAHPLSIFFQEDSLLPPDVTGEYEMYTDALLGVYEYATSPSEVEAGTWKVMRGAAALGLGQPDLDYLGALAGISISSAYQWHEFEMSGGFDSDGGGDTDQAMSLFRLEMSRWGKIGWADLGGAIMGARGGPVWMIVGTLVASGVMAMNTM